MKKYFFMFIAALVFLNAFGSNEVSAQTLKNIEVEVAFDFRVGDKLYPAGVYRLESAGQIGDNVLRLRDEKDKSRLIIANLSYADRQQSPKLVFRQIGGEYYLTNVFLTDGRWGFSVRPSRRQRGKNPESAKVVEIPAKN